MRPPITPQTLLRKLAGAPQDDARWYIFFALYSPLVENWIRLRGLPEALVEDALQDVCLRLARVLRDRMYDATRARFRTYMGVIVDNVVRDHFRKIRVEATRRARLREHLQTSLSADALPVNERLDLQFRLAAYQVALDRLRHDASLSPLQRAVLDECILNEGSPTALARRLGRFPNTIVQIRRRLLARVRAYLDTFYAT